MMLNPINLLNCLHTLDPFCILCVHVLVCGCLILAVFPFFGLMGLYLYGALATVAGNISVLKITTFPFYDKPIALGTVLFMSLFLCSDIVSETFGKKQALKLIWVGFLSYFLFSVFMYMLLAYPPAEGNLFIQKALSILFVPAPAIFVASLSAYFVSQYTDVFIYNFLKKLTGEAGLWVRSLISTVLGALVDNTIFSVLLWYVFAPTPKGFEEIFWTYGIGVLLMRFILSFVNIAFMYGAKLWGPKSVILKEGCH